MAKENVKAFFEALSKDEAMQQALNAKELAFTGMKEDREAVAEEIVIPVAKEAGYEFTLEELREFEEGLRPAGELDEDELEAVSGGVFCIAFCVSGGSGYNFGLENNEGFAGFGLCILIGLAGNPFQD